MIIWFYRRLLTLYPLHIRHAFAAEMESVFRQSVESARDDGIPAIVTLCLRELRDLPRCLAQAYGQSWRELRPGPIGAPSGIWIISWTLLTTMAQAIAFFIVAPLGALLLLRVTPLLRWLSPDTGSGSIRALGFVAGLAIVTSLVQWLLLQRWLPGAGWWVSLTLSGWAISVVVVSGIIFASSKIRGWDNLLLLIIPPLVGIAVGSTQGVYLHKVIKHGRWWILINLLAFSSLSAFGRPLESLIEITVLLFPGAITALGLWILLRSQSEQKATKKGIATNQLPEQRRRVRMVWVIPLMILTITLSPYIYARANLSLAKQDGIYATPEEAITALTTVDWGGAHVVRVSDLRAGPNWSDGRLPHVWFGGARYWMDRNPTGYDRNTFSGGSFYIQVEEGWVHIPEGSFPGLIGEIMALYGMEGATFK